MNIEYNHIDYIELTENKKHNGVNYAYTLLNKQKIKEYINNNLSVLREFVDDIDIYVYKKFVASELHRYNEVGLKPLNRLISFVFHMPKTLADDINSKKEFTVYIIKDSEIDLPAKEGYVYCTIIRYKDEK